MSSSEIDMVSPPATSSSTPTVTPGYSPMVASVSAVKHDKEYSNGSSSDSNSNSSSGEDPTCLKQNTLVARTETRASDMSEDSTDDMLEKPSVMTRDLKVLVAFFTYINFVLGFTVAFSIVETLYLQDDRGVSVSTVSFGKSIARVPVLFRILVGAFGDKYNLFGLGHRKPYIVGGIIMTTFGYIGLAILDSMHENFTVDEFAVAYYALVTFVLSMVTIFDSAGDGLITESIPNDRAGKSQGIINFGRGMGSVCGFVGVGLISSLVSYSAVFIVMAVMVASTIPFSFLLKEVPEEKRQRFNFAAFKIFYKPHIQVACVFVFVLNMPSVGSLFLIPIHVDELGFTGALPSIALAVAAIFVAIGSIVSGMLLDRFRSRINRVFHAVIIFGVIATAGFILSLEVPPLVFIFGALGGVFIGGMLALVFSLTMIIADPGGVFIGGMLALVFSLTMIIADPVIAGSFFAILSTVWKAGEIVGLAITGPVVENYGFGWAWALTCFLIAILLPIVYVMFKLADKAALEASMPTKVEAVEMDPEAGESI